MKEVSDATKSLPQEQFPVDHIYDLLLRLMHSQGVKARGNKEMKHLKQKCVKINLRQSGAQTNTITRFMNRNLKHTLAFTQFAQAFPPTSTLQLAVHLSHKKPISLDF